MSIGFGKHMWDFENPLYEKVVGSSTYRITKDNGDKEPSKPFRLFQDQKLLGVYESAEKAIHDVNRKTNKKSSGMSM